MLFNLEKQDGLLSALAKLDGGGIEQNPEVTFHFSLIHVAALERWFPSHSAHGHL